MPKKLSAADAAARLEPEDSLGLPIGPGQRPAFLEALGEREDWRKLRGLRRPADGRNRALRASGGPLPLWLLRPLRACAARLRRQRQLRPGRLPSLRAPVRGAVAPGDGDRCRPADAEGWCSLSLHAGGTLAELQGKTVHQRGEALAAIARPDFREQLMEAAERASGGQPAADV